MAKEEFSKIRDEHLVASAVHEEARMIREMIIRGGNDTNRTAMRKIDNRIARLELRATKAAEAFSLACRELEQAAWNPDGVTLTPGDIFCGWGRFGYKAGDVIPADTYQNGAGE